MATIILRDDFIGSGTLEGHAANVNTLGPGGQWSTTGGAELSGGYLQADSAGSYVHAYGSMFADGAVTVGTAMRFTFRWQPAGFPTDYPTLGGVYPIGINFGCAMAWVTAGVSGCSMNFMAFGTTFASQNVDVVFEPGTWYDGELTVANGLQTLNFLGQSLTLGDEMLPEALVFSLYFNMDTLTDGTTGKLEFIQAESIPAAEKFWTRHVNTREVLP